MDQLLKQLSPEAGEAKRAAFEADVNKQKDLIKNSVGKLGVVKSDLENISGLLAK